jgi:hypothetical protein
MTGSSTPHSFVGVCVLGGGGESLPRSRTFSQTAIRLAAVHCIPLLVCMCVLGGGGRGEPAQVKDAFPDIEVQLLAAALHSLVVGGWVGGWVGTGGESLSGSRTLFQTSCYD